MKRLVWKGFFFVLFVASVACGLYLTSFACSIASCTKDTQQELPLPRTPTEAAAYGSACLVFALIFLWIYYNLTDWLLPLDPEKLPPHTIMRAPLEENRLWSGLLMSAIAFGLWWLFYQGLKEATNTLQPSKGCKRKTALSWIVRSFGDVFVEPLAKFIWWVLLVLVLYCLIQYVIWIVFRGNTGQKLAVNYPKEAQLVSVTTTTPESTRAAGRATLLLRGLNP